MYAETVRTEFGAPVVVRDSVGELEVVEVEAR